MMDELLMLAGSEVAALHCDPLSGVAELRLAAAQVRQAGRLGHLMGLRLRFTGAHCEGDLAGAFGRIDDARLHCGPGRPRGEWPLHQPITQPLVLHLAMGHGAKLVLHAASLHCTGADGPFVESHAC